MPLTHWERTLFARAREYIASGRLPRTVPASLWAGPGSGTAKCSLCEKTIEPEHIEYELPGGPFGVQARFHLRCHAMWQFAADDAVRTAPGQSQDAGHFG
jgi:hypothetical protein